MSTADSNAFAHLSDDIIVDVLEIGCPKFEDLAQIELTGGRWADVIQRGKKFARGTLSERVHHVLEQYYYGIKQTTRIKEHLHMLKSWDDLLLTDLKIVIGAMPFEFEKRILRHATERVSVEFKFDFERAAEVFGILATRPITYLKIWSLCLLSGDSFFVQWEQSFRTLLTNPFLQRLLPCGKMFKDVDLLDAFTAFIKQPNFLYLHTDAYNKCTNELLPAVMEHWLQLTVFPSQMQGVSLVRCEKDFNSFLRKLGFQRSASRAGQSDRFVHYKAHPTDDSKRIEAFVYCGQQIEFSLTSKEESIGEEFGEYENFQVHKLGHLNSSNHCWGY